MVIKYGSTPQKFSSTWDTTKSGSANDTVVLPLVVDGSYLCTVDWGDGKSNRVNITGHDQSEITHQYNDTGVYSITIAAHVGDLAGWQFNNSGDDDKLTEVMEWGPLRFVIDDTNLFKGCSNLTLSATSDPPFNADAAGMFQDCASLTSNGGNILNWDMSAVTGMNFMLAGCTGLDVDLSSWDVSSIENASGFMQGCTLSLSNYDRILSGWSSQAVQSGVTISFGSSQHSIETGQAYKAILTSPATGWIILDGGTPPFGFRTVWDTTRVENSIYGGNSTPNDTIRLPLHESGFYDFTVAWGDGTEDHITTYNQSEATHQYPSTGIYSVSITGGITGWKFLATNQAPIFSRDRKKLIEVNGWGPLVINNFGAFHYTTDLTINATDSLTMFDPSWYIQSNSENGSENRGMHFQGVNWGTGIVNLDSWNITGLTNWYGTFYMSSSNFDADIGNWDMSNAHNLAVMFAFNTHFNNGGSPSISGWDVSNVRSMRQMFDGASSFNQPIGSWNVTNAGYGIYGGNGFEYMFRNATSFNQDISSWDISNAITLNYMFDGATAFQQNIGNWDVSNLAGLQWAFMNNKQYPTANYDNLLIGWSSQNVQNGVYIGFGTSKYSAGSAASARATLVSKGWTIIDGGQA